MKQASVEALEAALAAHEAGLCVLPPNEDGSKTPLGEGWKKYQTTRPSQELIQGWYSRGRTGVGYVCGKVSQNLEVVDFDDRETYGAYKREAIAAGLAELVERIETGYLEESPNGIHWFFRCSAIEGNKRLAQRPTRDAERQDAPDNKWKAIIETRGEGGYIVAAPSNGKVHKSERPYRLVCGGPGSIAGITPEEREKLFSLAQLFDQQPPPVYFEPGASSLSREGRPGDDFNDQASWEDILLPCGWEPVHQIGDKTLWRRPGTENRWSASTNYADSNLFYCWSSSTVFDPGRGYSKFAVYAYLNHSGDFPAAARDLVRQGYGEQTTRSRGGTDGAIQDILANDLYIGQGGDQNSICSQNEPENGILANDTPPIGQNVQNPESWEPRRLSTLKRDPDGTKWLLDGYLGPGQVTLLTGIWKSGKTTLLARLLGALGDGSTTFIGQGISQGSALVVTEESPRVWAARRDELPLGDHITIISRPFRGGRPNLKNWRSSSPSWPTWPMGKTSASRWWSSMPCRIYGAWPMKTTRPKSSRPSARYTL